MADTNKIIFVDESGDTVLPDNDEHPSIYTIVAILVDSDEIDDFRGHAKSIVESNAGSGELKSSNIGNNLRRRQKILSAIADANFSFYCLVVDKQQILKDSGLQYKPSSYKFLHRMFYSRLRRSLPSMDVISDPYGRTEFMQSFIKYITANGNLFDTLEFISSPEEPLLQIADVVAGSIRRVYQNEDPVDNLTILGYPQIPIEEWPPNIIRYSDFPDDTEEQKFNSLIRRIALNVARDFVQDHIDDDDPELRGLAEAARFLLYNYHLDPTKYVFKYRILKHLKEIGVRNNPRSILSKLRDNDLIICSTERGVKIPYDSQDIRMWVDRVNSQVVPYLKRLEKARNDFLIASDNEYDIVNKDIYSDLAKYIHHQIRI